MALESGFFNSVNNDRLYNARDISRYFENVLSSGIFKRIENCFKVSAFSGMNLSVAPGAGLIECQWFRSEIDEGVTVPTAHAVLPRFDNVVARLDLSDSVRAITLTVVPGTPAEAPKAPDPVRTADIYDLVLALVYVPAGATEITEANLTDVRSNDWYCGYVHSLVDTPVLKTYNARYVAASDNTTVAPISIVGFNPLVDILNVYVNGFKLAPEIEYTLNETTSSITLAEPVDTDTIIDFEAFRPIMPDDMPDLAETVTDMAQTITTLNSTVATLNGRTAELETDTGWMQLAGADGIRFSEMWVPKLRKIGKVVHLRGLCTGVTANQTQILTIPEGYRPPAGGHAYVGYCGNAENVRTARLFVEETGEVIFRSAGEDTPADTDPILITTSWLID